MSIIKNIIINSNNSYISALNSEKKIFIVKHLLDMDYRFYKMTLVGSDDLCSYPVYYSQVVRRSNFRFSYDRPGSQSIYNQHGGSWLSLKEIFNIQNIHLELGNVNHVLYQINSNIGVLEHVNSFL